MFIIKEGNIVGEWYFVWFYYWELYIIKYGYDLYYKVYYIFSKEVKF